MAIKRISPIIFLAICGEIGKKQKKSEAIIFPVMVFSCCLILIYPLGTNDGAYLTYHTQLLMPLLAYWASENSNGKYLNSLCCQILVSLSLVYCVYKIPMISIPDDSGWKKIESYIRDGDSFYNSECVAPIILQQNKKIVNDGVSGFVYGFNKREITEALFHKDNILLDKKTSYINSLKDGCNQQRFSYLLLAHKVGETTSCQYEKNGYELIDDISLDLPCNWPIMVSVYKPTKDYRK